MATSKKPLLIALLVAGGFIGLLCCGGMVLLTNWGFDLMAEEVADQIRESPQIQEHLGEIESCEMDFASSIADDDTDIYVYDVVGTKGKGRVTTVTGDDDEVSSATLVLPDGQRIKVTLPVVGVPLTAERPPSRTVIPERSALAPCSTA